jgi:hypothetical protein
MPEYSCKMKTLFLFVLIILVFIIIFTYTQPRSIINSVRTTTTTLPLPLQNLEKFLDLIELTAAENPNKPVPGNILSDYDKILSNELRTKLISSGNDVKNINETNRTRMITQLNTLDTNMRGLLSDVNTKLYKQLTDNYSRAQHINAIRSDWLSDINDLPYAAIS